MSAARQEWEGVAALKASMAGRSARRLSRSRTLGAEARRAGMEMELGELKPGASLGERERASRLAVEERGDLE